MVSNNTSMITYKLAVRYPGKVGLLLSPDGWRDPWPLPFAIDNGAYGVWKSGGTWDSEKFINILDKTKTWSSQYLHDYHPLFIVVPDVVTDPVATIKQWNLWGKELKVYDWPLAFVLQNGMTPADLPKPLPDVLFVGGTYRWKIQQISNPGWFGKSGWFHVGRIFSWQDLELCSNNHVDSVDSTAFFRDGIRFDQNQKLFHLTRFLQGEKFPQGILPLGDCP
jgi:hypothetical protein